MIHFKLPVLNFCFLLSCCLQGQELLRLEDAISTALKSSHSITVVKLQSQVAGNNHHQGNAGFFPTISLNASKNFSNNKINQEYANGLIINQSGVKSNGLNAGLNLNWTIFDGFKMFATLEKLSLLDEQGQLNLKIEIENTLSKVILAYYDVVRQQQLIQALNESVKISEERIKLAQKKLDIGSGSKQEWLQAKIDLTAQQSALLKQSILRDNARIQLNQLLSRPSDLEFTVSDSIPLSDPPAYEDLKKSSENNNNQLLALQKNISMATQTIQESRSPLWPQLGINTAYNFIQSRNQAGFVLLNQNLGFNAAITANWTLFNGFKNHLSAKNAALNLVQSQEQYKLTALNVEASLLKAWKNYYAALSLVKLEQENIRWVRENMAIALERFKLGSAVSLELMMAQRSFEDALGRYISARYEAKVAETELRRLNGALVSTN